MTSGRTSGLVPFLDFAFASFGGAAAASGAMLACVSAAGRTGRSLGAPGAIFKALGSKTIGNWTVKSKSHLGILRVEGKMTLS